MKRFTINAGPGSNYKLKIVVHDTEAQLDKAFEGPCSAFFDPVDEKKIKKDLVIGSIHFWKKKLHTSLISHEAVHAQMHHSRVIKMLIGSDQGEEWYAECVEHTVAEIKKNLRKS